ncbi:MAG: hypothetical protein JSS29_08620 [Proteobacteria bacterium]|nr:hypothetical protein [Pseudomonadota bacterium]
MTEAVHLFGVRHHGPGSARSLLRALESLAPDCVLIEGPPDADELLPLAAKEGLEPPVALLVYRTDSPRHAVFYPFARYSPEWQAIQFALSRALPVRFIDLPQSARLRDESEAGAEGPSAGEDPPEARSDALAPIARAAGYDDPERWWDHLVESRSGKDAEVFRALRELMGAVRNEIDADPPLLERRREAFMRKSIRAAMSEGFQRIAVICGAYHTPALDPMPTAKADDAILKGLPKVKTAAAWVPWTYERLSYQSGYGAGVESPVWYELLWERRTARGAEWLSRAARLLREADAPISSAHVIEACRLAETLAAVRERPAATLAEYRDAAVAVLGDGSPTLMELIGRRWYFGSRLGTVPADFPAAPLVRDLAAEQGRLRLPPKADEKTHDLDLREPLDRERGSLLRRLRILGVEWAVPAAGGVRSRGTFHEVWRLRWQPEFAVALVEASRYGHTIAQAAIARIVEAAESARTLPELVERLEDVLFADLPEGVAPLVNGIRSRTAVATDVLQLLDALPPLVEVSRYGNVRGTDVAQVSEILAGLIPRLFIGVLPASIGIDEAAARLLWSKLKATHQALITLDDASYREGWLQVLERLSGSESIQALVRGYAARALYDAGRLETAQLEQLFGLALSTGADPTDAALWIEGLLSGNGAVLIHDDRLRGIVDRWLRSLSQEHFTQILPLLRRTFAEFPPAERRIIGGKFKGGAVAARDTEHSGDFDVAAARAVIPILKQIWGIGGDS